LPQVSSAHPLGMPFIELQSVDSTNNYALQQVHAGLAQHGTAYFAHSQVAGKGQRGKTWVAETDSSLILSIVLNPFPLTVSQQFQLSACIAVSVCEFFTRYAGDAPRIKWPNDLYWHDRKAGGILIENIIGSRPREIGTPLNEEQKSSSWQWAVVGMGININQAKFASTLKNPVSLKQITGKHFDTIALAKELCEVLDKNFKTLLSQGFESVYQNYQSLLYKRNELVKLKKGNRIFEATILEVTPTGSLQVLHSLKEEYGFGEIEWVIEQPNLAK
jgi:BirA family transcriptional regulator, biotin operon repressor / biotin---[acetyl-CoA-carboxylase] ligase